MIKLNSKKGFTLLEALVAISILMVAVVAPITIAQKGLSSSIYSKNQMIASYLAQDAIEYIKNKRDQNVINDPAGDWLSGLEFCLEPDYCGIDTIGTDGNGFVQDNEEISLTKTRTDGFYGYIPTDSDETNFKRKIIIEVHDIDGSLTDVLTGLPLPPKYNEALVTVEVRWGEGDNFVTVKTLIYNY